MIVLDNNLLEQSSMRWVFTKMLGLLEKNLEGFFHECDCLTEIQAGSVKLWWKTTLLYSVRNKHLKMVRYFPGIEALLNEWVKRVNHSAGWRGRTHRKILQTWILLTLGYCRSSVRKSVISKATIVKTN